ncbi:hypothetical protein [Lysinibacillus telephonicus]|uniref:hypothetical protein n=1 Tax=Lysinibacillus telephonicus TaxID=1714840 RepID=UPI0037D6CC6C
MDGKKSILKEFKQASQMDKFNFIASIVTISGLSIFTVLSGIDKFNTYKVGFYLIYFALVLLVVSLIIGLYYWTIISIKKDSSPIYFLVTMIILTSFGIGVLLIIITAAWEFISIINFERVD